MSNHDGIGLVLNGLLEDLPEAHANALRRESIRAEKPVALLIRDALLEKAERLTAPSPEDAGADAPERDAA